MNALQSHCLEKVLKLQKLMFIYHVLTTYCMYLFSIFISFLLFRLAPDTQFNLLTRNLTMMFLVQSFKKPQPQNVISSQQPPNTQLLNDEEVASKEPPKTSIEVTLCLRSPWAADVNCEQQFHLLRTQMNELYIDEKSSLLLSLMALFEPVELSNHMDKVQETQQFFNGLTHRYLKKTIGDAQAGMMIESFVKSVKDLREMADILDFQRLRL